MNGSDVGMGQEGYCGPGALPGEIGVARPVRARWRYRVISVLVGLAAAFLLGEVILWRILPPQDRFFVWTPYYHATLHPDPTLLPGITGAARLSINSSGIRGDELSDKQQYQILAVGGSTTECLSLDQTEVWTHLLQVRLSEAKRMPVWVGNVGRSGRNTREHILQVKYLLPQLPTLDAVILLVGVNDLHIRLSDLKYDQYVASKGTFEADYIRRAFDLVPSPLPVYHYKRLGWWRLARKAKAAYLTDTSNLPVQDSTGNTLAQWRRYRKNAEAIVDAVPDLSSALQEYRRNVERIADLSRQHGVRLFLVTQPSLWRPDLTQQEKDLLWMGGVGYFQLGKGHQYYSVSVLDWAMRQYNETLLDVCRTRGIECIDLASAVPKDTTVFYDDVHFTESGARQVADVLFRHLSLAIQ